MVVVFRVSLVLVVLGIAYLSLTPLETITVGNDKISHFIAYAVLMSNVGMLTFDRTRNFILGIVLCLAYGSLIEIAQHFVPGRFMSLLDVGANGIGVLFGVLFTVFFYAPLRQWMKW